MQAIKRCSNQILKFLTGRGGDAGQHKLAYIMAMKQLLLWQTSDEQNVFILMFQSYHAVASLNILCKLFVLPHCLCHQTICASKTREVNILLVVLQF